MEKLFAYFLDRKFLVNLITLFIVVVGGFLALGLRRDLVPSMSFKGMSVSVELPGASALQMESFVIRPIENVLKNLSGLKEMNSESRPGSAMIHLRYTDRTSHEAIAEHVEEIRSRLTGLRDQLPEDLKEPRVHQWKRESSWFMSLALVNADARNELHRNTLISIQQELAKVPGVVSVNSSLPAREVYVRLDPAKLVHYGLNSSQIAAQIEKQLKPIPVTSLRVATEDISVTLPDPIQNPQSLGNLVLRTSDFGRSLRLSDVGVVEDYFPPQTQIDLVNGKAYVDLWLKKDLESDIVTLDSQVIAKVDELKKKVPEGLELRVLGQGANMIRQQINVLKGNALAGAVLVLLLLGFFLGSRVALMTAIGIPLSYLGSVIILKAAGISINLISVVAMILVVGILVDDAIVVSEIYTTYLRKGMQRREAALRAALRMLGPVTAGIITTMIAFFPIVILGGWLTEVFISIPVVVISSLAVSWFEAFFILPQHLQRFVKKTYERPRILDRMESVYERSLSWVVKKRAWGAVVFIALAVGTAFIWQKKITTSFDLSIGPREVNVYAILKGNPTKDEALQALRPLVDHLAPMVDGKDVKDLFLSIGDVWMDGKRHRGNRYASLYLAINDKLANPDVVESRLLEQLKTELPKFKTEAFERLNAEGQFSKSDDEKSDENLFDLYFSGSETRSFQDIFTIAETRLKTIPGFVDLTYNQDDLGRSWKFRWNLEALRSYGISETELSQQLREVMDRNRITQIFYQGETLPVSIGFGALDTFARVEDLKSIEVLGPNGQLLPLRYLGEWSEENTQSTWRRMNGERMLNFKVKMDPTKTRNDEFKSALALASTELEQLFSGYRVSSEEANKQAGENKRWMMEALLICVVGIFFVIALQLQSFTQPLLVCFSILFGFIGTLWATWLHGYKFDLMTMIGLLGVAGISVNASLILVDWINKKSSTTASAIVEGCRERLQPILLTTVTTLGGLFPMAYGLGGDAGFTRFLAFSMAWGILSSTLLTLFLMPVLLMLRSDLFVFTDRFLGGGKRFFGRWKLRQRSPESVQPRHPTSLEPEIASQPGH